jgi:hypothetical protein
MFLLNLVKNPAVRVAACWEVRPSVTPAVAAASHGDWTFPGVSRAVFAEAVVTCTGGAGGGSVILVAIGRDIRDAL